MNLFRCIILLLLCLGCNHDSPNYLLDDFTESLIENVSSDVQLDHFKSQPLDSAIWNYNLYPELFHVAASKLLADSIEQVKFEESMQLNDLSTVDPREMYLIAAIVHNHLNKKAVILDELKEHVYPLYNKKIVLAQKNNADSEKDDYCYIEELVVIGEFLKDSIHRITYLDAGLVLDVSNNVCKNNVEFSEVYSETLFSYLDKRPNHIVELIEQGDYPSKVIDIICRTLEDPIHDGIEIKYIIQQVEKLPKSFTKLKILEALYKADAKYN